MIDLSHQKFRLKDFSDQDLSKANLSNSEFICCKFRRTNLEKANCQSSLFSGSDFTDAVLRYTNFAYSDLQDTIFYPKDAFGVVFSMECKTFKGMKISKMWWWSYRFFSLMMLPEEQDSKNAQNNDIAILGSRYNRLCKLFEIRGM